MVRFLLSLRYVLLLATLGALVGAALMLGLAGSKLVSGAQALLSSPIEPREITGAVMGAIDALLFAVVLIVFAYAIAFGFVLDGLGERMPGWMRPQGVGELKRTLIEVILVYLVVDFATDLSQEEAHPTWTHLVVPIAVFLVAGAMRLLPAHGRAPDDRAHPPAAPRP